MKQELIKYLAKEVNDSINFSKEDNPTIEITTKQALFILTHLKSEDTSEISSFHRKQIEFVSLMDTANMIYHADHLSWEEKYDKIFSPEISRVIFDLADDIGVSTDYYQSDTTYQEDVSCFIEHFTKHRDKIQDGE